MSNYVGYIVQAIILGIIGWLVNYFFGRIRGDIDKLNERLDECEESSQEIKESLIRLQEHAKDSSETYKLRIEINDKYVLKDTYEQYTQTLLNNVSSLSEKIESINNKIFKIVSEKADE